MKSPFDFDISAAKDKKRRTTRRRSASGAFEHSSRICEHPGCEEDGKYRAPKSATELDQYRWFCLPHIREYNAKWNFFEGVDPETLEDRESEERLGKTRPFTSEEAKAWARMGVQNPYEVLRDKATQRREGASPRLRLNVNERKAVEILGASPDASKTELRKLYKSLVKDLHPDRNAGARDDEARLNEVVWAWDQIKDSRNFAK